MPYLGGMVSTLWRGQIHPNPKVSQQTFATPPKTSPVTSDQRFSLLHFFGEICSSAEHLPMTGWLKWFFTVKLPFFAKSRVFSGFGSAPWRTLLLSPRDASLPAERALRRRRAAPLLSAPSLETPPGQGRGEAHGPWDCPIGNNGKMQLISIIFPISMIYSWLVGG